MHKLRCVRAHMVLHWNRYRVLAILSGTYVPYAVHVDRYSLYKWYFWNMWLKHFTIAFVFLANRFFLLLINTFTFYGWFRMFRLQFWPRWSIGISLSGLRPAFEAELISSYMRLIEAEATGIQCKWASRTIHKIIWIFIIHLLIANYFYLNCGRKILTLT